MEKTYIAPCAICGEERELCNSVNVDGMQQPRICKDCLIAHKKNSLEINETHWIRQVIQLNDFETLDKLRRLI